MRIAILSTIFASAGALAACSGGGPGPLDISPLDLGREPVSDGTFGSPYEAPPNRGASIPTSQESPTGQSDTNANNNGNNGNNGARDGGTTVVTVDAGVSDNFDAGNSSTDGSITTDGTCADLEDCCAAIADSTQKTGCENALTSASGNDETCGQYYSAYKNGQLCP
jgi:hypothetical protein